MISIAFKNKTSNQAISVPVCLLFGNQKYCIIIQTVHQMMFYLKIPHMLFFFQINASTFDILSWHSKIQSPKAFRHSVNKQNVKPRYEKQFLSFVWQPESVRILHPNSKLIFHLKPLPFSNIFHLKSPCLLFYFQINAIKFNIESLHSKIQ